MASPDGRGIVIIIGLSRDIPETSFD